MTHFSNDPHVYDEKCLKKTLNPPHPPHVYYTMVIKNTTLDDLSSIIGLSATIRLAAWWGGKNLYIPADPDGDMRLTSLIGLPAARRLTAAYAREHIAVPSLHGLMIEQRNVRIFYDLTAGKSIKEIAQKNDLSERRVAQIRDEYRRLNLLL